MPDSDPPRRLAITREVSRAITRCELTHIEREPIDLQRARSQHAAYEACLRRMGCEVMHLGEARDLPDSVFVEDVAVVFQELAVITRPGAASRRPEADLMAEVLARYRPIVRLEAPAILDGGDVLVMGQSIYVGRSERSNEPGHEQLAAATAPHGYRVVPVDFDGCLHLKSAATPVGRATALVQTQWVSPAAFGDATTIIEVDASEPFGGNVLQVNGVILCAAAFPRTRQRLEQHGFEVMTVDASELAKAEGGLTCCSLVFEP